MTRLVHSHNCSTPMHRLLIAAHWLRMILIVWGTLLGNGFAEEKPSRLKLALPFGDHMVLQRDLPLPIWGEAATGENVTVHFAGQELSTIANMEGNWQVKLAPLTVSLEPRELKVATLSESLVCRHVLVGDVWLCAGQSNMEWPLEKETHAIEALREVKHNSLRLLNLNYAGQNFSAKPFGKAELARQTAQNFYRGEWQCALPETVQSFSAVGYYFGKKLQSHIQNIPIGLIHMAVGGSPTEAWISRETLAANAQLKAIVHANWMENVELEPWCRQRGYDNLKSALQQKLLLPTNEMGPCHAFQPGFLWEAGIARVMTFGIRGVIWYQGESNSLSLRRVQQHEQLFPLLVYDWRTQWQQGAFPFLYCQLSSIGTTGGYQSHFWPEFRDSQRRMLEIIPNTGMAVTSDIGHTTDVHPRNKRDVGERLALWALAKSYSQSLPYSGPLAESIKQNGKTLHVKFEHVFAGLSTSNGKPVSGFEIAGENNEFQPATATIEADSVLLESHKIAQPKSVRYGWQPFSQGNLINSAKLPASTFRLSLPPNNEK
jgi:sialate O-acetylesterase